MQCGSGSRCVRGCRRARLTVAESDVCSSSVCSLRPAVFGGQVRRPKRAGIARGRTRTCLRGADMDLTPAEIGTILRHRGNGSNTPSSQEKPTMQDGAAQRLLSRTGGVTRPCASPRSCPSCRAASPSASSSQRSCWWTSSETCQPRSSSSIGDLRPYATRACASRSHPLDLYRGPRR